MESSQKSDLDKTNKDDQRDRYVYLATLAENSERYDEMVSNMREVAKMGTGLDVELRNMFSVGYKNVIGARRSSWRIISSLEQKEESKRYTDKFNEDHLNYTKEYRKVIEKELGEICEDILDVIEKYLLNTADTNDSKVFYLKMKADYYRYLAEFLVDEDRKNASDKALKAYQDATDIAKSECGGLNETHPIRLGLALNFSVFYYEIMNEPDKACSLAKSAFDEAIHALDTLKEQNYKDSTLILQLLRDNLTLWTSDGVNAEGEAEKSSAISNEKTYPENKNNDEKNAK